MDTPPDAASRSSWKGVASRPSWTGARVARPARDLDRSTAFYRDLLGLRPRGGFQDHEGYDGLFFALPGGGELELTAGPVEPAGGTEEDLLVFYLGNLAEVGQLAARLDAARVRAVESANPYWSRLGRTLLDPDGYRIVIAAADSADDAAPSRPDPEASIDVDWHVGDRSELRPLFELAEDSERELDSYLDAGRVLVARRNQVVVGHLQLVGTRGADELELKNMAVLAEQQGLGIGRTLVERAIQQSRAEGVRRITVATAAADIGNLRFYQRVGFRLRSVEPDAFTAANGYRSSLLVDGTPLLDRVWLSQEL
jgi:ribosomal protein S18 acetylase RimI-like enzyme